jgi:hypothetical protein
MDAKAILTDYESAKKQKADAELLKREQETIRRRLNGARIEEHLNAVVEPVLDSAQQQVIEFGYKCEIHRINKRYAALPKEEEKFALCLRLNTSNEPEAENLNCALEFSGDSNSATIRIETRTGGNFSKPEGPFTLDMVTTDFTDKRVAAFLKSVFRP